MNRGFLEIRHRGKPVQIEYLRQDKGQPENPVLVFLHEGLGTAASWKTAPEELGHRTRCRIFSYTRLGYGNSSGLEHPRKINYLHNEALKVLPQVLAAADINRYILVGHSDGGSISLIHGGGLRPDGLKGIITLAAHLFCETITVQGLKQARDRYVNGDLKRKLERVHGANTETAFWGWNDTWLAPRFMHWNIEKFLPLIPVPVLGLQGVDDPYGTLRQLTAMETGARNCRTLAIEDCGHIPHLQQPGPAISAMADFVRSLL